MKSSLRRSVPAFVLGMVLASSPGLAGYETDAADGQSLSGSYLAGRFAGRQRDMNAAAEYFQQALRDDPSNAVLIERVFIFEVSQGDVEGAEDFATRVLSFNSQHRMARIVLGLRDARLKRYDEARQNFKKSAYTPIGELTSVLLTAWTYAAEGNQAAAFRALDKLDSNDSFGPAWRRVRATPSARAPRSWSTRSWPRPRSRTRDIRQPRRRPRR
jgi:tetratricopeptide (TPR) repeat protein